MTTYVEIGADTSKYEAAMKRTLGTTDSILSMLSSGWVKAGAVAAGAVMVLDKTWDQVAIGAKVEQQTRAFDNMAMSFGENGAAMIQELKLASGEALDTMTIIEKAGTAMMMGIAPEKLSSLMEIARMTSRQTGQEVSQAFSDIALAVGRQSKMILDNLGIIVNVEKANERYAAKLGKTAASLSEAERKQAFLNATVEEGENLMGKLGDKTRTSSETVQMMTSDMKDMASSGARMVSNLLLPNLEALAGAIHRTALYWTGSLTPDPQPMLTLLETQKRAIEMERAKMEGIAAAPGTLDAALSWIPGYVTKDQAEEMVRVLGKRIDLVAGTIANYRLEQVGPIAAGMVSSIRPAGSAELPKTDEKAAREMAALEERATLEMAKSQETLTMKSGMELFMEQDLQNKLIGMREERLNNQVGMLQQALGRQLSEHDVYLQVREPQIEHIEKEAIELQQYKNQLQRDQLRGMVDNWLYIFETAGQESDTAFKLFQAVAVNKTLYDTGQAAVRAYDAMRDIPYVGEYLAIAAAAAAAAAGLMAVQKIMSASPGRASTAMGVYPASPTTGFPENFARAPERGTVTFIIKGDFVGSEEDLRRFKERVERRLALAA